MPRDLRQERLWAVEKLHSGVRPETQRGYRERPMGNLVAIGNALSYSGR